MLIGEYELPQFQIPKNDSVFVANLDGLGDLAKQLFGLRFAKSLPRPDVRMQIAVRFREYQVQVAISRYHFVDGGYAGVEV